MIDTSKPIKTVTYNGVEIPLDGGGECPEFQTEEITVKSLTNKSQTFTPTKDGFSKVTVEGVNVSYGYVEPKSTMKSYEASHFGSDYLAGVDVGAVPTEQKTITENGTYTPTEGKWFDSVTVNVEGQTPTYDTPSITVSTNGLITASANGKSNTQQLTTQASKTVTPSETEQTAVATQTFTTGAVKVGAISSTYVGSGVTKQEAKTVSPTESEQTAVASGVYTTGAVKVGAISTTYVGSGVTKRSSTDLTSSGATVTVPAGYYASQATKSISSGSIVLNTITVSTSGLITASGTTTAGYVSNNPTNKTLQLTTKAGTTITPSNSQQTAISSGTYATGNIVVSAVPTETKTVSENGTVTPTSGKYLSSVTVNIPIQKYYTGSTNPASSLGNDGDLYLKA